MAKRRISFLEAFFFSINPYSPLNFNCVNFFSIMWRESRFLLRSPLVIQHIKCHARNVSLLQNDKDVDNRKMNLQNARKKYKLEQNTFNLSEDQKDQVDLVNVPPLVSIYIIL